MIKNHSTTFLKKTKYSSFLKEFHYNISSRKEKKMDYIVQTKDLCKKYSGKFAVDNVNMNIKLTNIKNLFLK